MQFNEYSNCNMPGVSGGPILVFASPDSITFCTVIFSNRVPRSNQQHQQHHTAPTVHHSNSLSLQQPPVPQQYDPTIAVCHCGKYCYPT